MSRTAVAYLKPPDELLPSADLELVAVVTGELADALRLLAEANAQTLFVQRLHAVAGSLGELTRLLAWLDGYGADLLCAQPQLDTSTKAGRSSMALLREIDRWGREPEQPRRPRGRPGLLQTTPGAAERIADLHRRGHEPPRDRRGAQRRGRPHPAWGDDSGGPRVSSRRSATSVRGPPPPGSRRGRRSHPGPAGRTDEKRKHKRAGP